MNHRLAVDALLPPLSPQLEVVLLARTLWREGYDDHLAGHITIKQSDGTFLTNPWFLLWEEITPDQIVRIDIDGNVVEGDWPPAPGVKLHLELHKRRAIASQNPSNLAVPNVACTSGARAMPPPRNST